MIDIMELELYIENKSKYYDLMLSLTTLELTQIGGGEEKRAVVFLCMLNFHYVFGACINAYTQKQLMKKSGETIDLVIMCDQTLYDEYHDLLSEYFDQIVKIDLEMFDLNEEKYKFNKGWINKYKWINYSINKWKCLQLVEYDKILFMDIDLMPVRKDFYQIFNYSTPAFHVIVEGKSDGVDGRRCDNNQPNSEYVIGSDKYEDYVVKENGFVSLDGGLVLLRPDKDLYEQYIEFVKSEFKKGMFSNPKSGPDETTLFYYYNKMTNNNPKFYTICSEYAVIPWDFSKEMVKIAKGYNFLSYVKPWLKPTFLSWDEEDYGDIYMTK
jgi:hypothetical protein